MASSRRRPRSHESRVFTGALAAGLPAVLVAVWLLWTGEYALRVRLTFTLIAVGAWLLGALLLRERVVRPLQTISNLLAALREADYSIRARGSGTEDALGLALLEVNALSETLRGQRLRRAGGDCAPETGDRGDRCGGVRLRRRPAAPPGQSRWRAIARPALGAADRPPFRRARPQRLARWREPADVRCDVPGRRGTLGSAERDVPAGRPASPAPRHLRSQPGAARRGAIGVAANRAGARPRDQQLPRADQVHRGQPAQPRGAAHPPDGLGERSSLGARGHRGTLGSPRTVHGRIRPPGPAPAAAARARWTSRRGWVGSPRWRPGSRSAWLRAPRSRSPPTAISSISC